MLVLHDAEIRKVPDVTAQAFSADIVEMKLDRNQNPDKSGKYALLKIRRLKRELIIEKRMYDMVTSRLAESLIFSLKRCNELSKEDEIKTLIPSVEQAVYEAEAASLAYFDEK